MNNKNMEDKNYLKMTPEEEKFKETVSACGFEDCYQLALMHKKIKDRILNDEILEDYHMYDDLFKVMKRIKYNTKNPVFTLDECLDMLNKLFWQEDRNELIDLAAWRTSLDPFWGQESKKSHDMNVSILMSVLDSVLQQYVKDTNHKDNLDEFIDKAETYINAVSKYYKEEAKYSMDMEAPVMTKIHYALLKRDLDRTVKIIKGEEVPEERPVYVQKPSIFYRLYKKLVPYKIRKIIDDLTYYDV